MSKSLVVSMFALLFMFPGIMAEQEIEYDVPYVPTKYEVVEEMLKIADVGKDDILYDLGCGDGRIVIAAAEKRGARGVGIDINPERIEESRNNAKDANVSDRIRFIQQDLFEADISEATVVTLYLLPEVNLRLRPKLFRELKPGTRVVSHDFDMGDWEPDEHNRTENNDYSGNDSIYFWIIPANVTGTWELTVSADDGTERYELQLNQQFQQFYGEATSGSTKIEIKDTKLAGDTIQFTLEQEVDRRNVRMKFEGQVSDNSMKGEVQSKTGLFTNKRTWIASRDPSTIVPLDSSDAY